jgi:hypothetical protein
MVWTKLNEIWSQCQVNEESRQQIQLVLVSSNALAAHLLVLN